MKQGATFLLQWVFFFPSFTATSESLSEFLPQTEEQLTPRTTPLSKAHPPRETLPKLGSIDDFANSVWSRVREWRLILLWNTELAKINQNMLGDLEILCTND